jgi:ATP-dependent helicase/nuclease subunit A
MTALECSEPAAGDPGWTDEQRVAIDRREGDLLLAASAGSGKTSVLVERFVRAVLEDGIDVGAILTITFTEKAAAEMRDRIRRRLHELGAVDLARATEGAFISTIHGFCARVLRAHAVLAGIDPAFSVLDEARARTLARGAFEDALEHLAAGDSGVVELIASHGVGILRGATLGVYRELRSRGELAPALPDLPPAPDLEGLRVALLGASAALASELDAGDTGAVRVAQAIERLAGCEEVVAVAEPWPGDLDRLALPGGNGAALSTPACAAYTEALARFREACAHRYAVAAHAPLDRLLRGFAARYEERKGRQSGLDFEDLELLTRELLLGDEDLRDRYRARFRRIMVDELQDTNRVQLELIDSLASGNLFTVGDAQQSIYGFRHADVGLFEARSRRMEQAGALARLRTNFRSRREILEVINAAFASDDFTPLVAGRPGPPAGEPRVELLLADKQAEWADDEGLASPWRLAEARTLAGRIGELVAAGAEPGEIVVLTRASTDLRLYERALEAQGVPTYVIGGRGYWSHPQVLDLVAYLRALANPRDEEALYNVLASPVVGVSRDALVVLAAAAREAERDPWWVLREAAGLLDELGESDREALGRFTMWFAAERADASRHPVEELIDRALERSGYDLAILAVPGGRRRLANVRKLMRLAREHELSAGRDLRAFLDQLTTGEGSDARESEAPVEGEALDAVRLMTIHRAKGLEFEVVCLADLGRTPRFSAELMQLGRDGRFGVRIGQPGTGRREPALAHQALREERMQEQADEERRLMYVAMTRARERLIVSGAARLDRWPEGNGGAPIGWLGPALVPDLCSTPAVSLTLVGESDGLVDVASRPQEFESPARGDGTLRRIERPGSVVEVLSYSSLGQYRRCAYRFYVERVLGVPPRSPAREGGEGAPVSWSGTERGVVVHGLLERLDFRRPLPPSPAMIAAACERAGIAAASDEQAGELAAIVGSFAQSGLCARLGLASEVRREQRFGFLLDDGVLITGALDVLARERDGMLVVDYKSDRLEGADPAEIVAREYAIQQLIYALAVLRSGAEAVEIVYVFLEDPDALVSAAFTRADLPSLESELGRLTEGVLSGVFPVAGAPHRGLCEGCPAEGGLCSWPLEMTRREALDTLF